MPTGGGIATSFEICAFIASVLPKAFCEILVPQVALGSKGPLDQ